MPSNIHEVRIICSISPVIIGIMIEMTEVNWFNHSATPESKINISFCVAIRVHFCFIAVEFQGQKTKAGEVGSKTDYKSILYNFCVVYFLSNKSRL